jgi:site-specific DNA recombinase
MAWDGYIRVSRVGGREGDSFQSSAEQRKQIEGWAKLKSVQVAEWHEDIDVSGGKLRRPGLDPIIARIESGASEGVIVAKLDRLSRLGVSDALKSVERITDAGGSIAAIDLGIDPTTPFGEFGMTIMLALARMERRRLSDSWLTARANAVARGAFVGPTPLGFKKGDSGALVPGEDAAAVRRAFEISSEAGLDIVLEFCRSTWPARFWNVTAVRKLLANRVYLGDVVSGDFTGREVIEPLVGEDIWYRAQHDITHRSASGTYPLSGIARCAECGGGLTGHKSGKVPKRSYCCVTPDCTRKVHLLAEPLEELVGQAIRAAADRWTSGPDHAELERLEQVRAAAQTELERYITDTAAVAAVGGDMWHKGLTARQDEFTAAQSACERALGAADMPDLDSPTPEDLRRMIAEFTVRKGREPLSERVELTLAA